MERFLSVYRVNTTGGLPNTRVGVGRFVTGRRGGEIGASEGIRTLDVHLGKVMLYQTELRSLP